AYGDEAALLEHADRADVASCHPCVEGPREILDELGQRACGQAAPPELLADPVAEQAPPILFPAPDVPRDLPVVNDRLLDQGVVREEASPVGVEDLAAACREERHLGRFRLTLVLVKGIEVALDNVAENVSHGPRGYFIGDVPPRKGV